jgi:hypothetical protein
MSVLVTRDDLLVGGIRGLDSKSTGGYIVDKDMAQRLSRGVYPPIFHRFRTRGIIVIRIYKNFNWVYVIIDERVPCLKKTKKPVFGSCT